MEVVSIVEGIGVVQKDVTRSTVVTINVLGELVDGAMRIVGVVSHSIVLVVILLIVQLVAGHYLGGESWQNRIGE